MAETKCPQVSIVLPTFNGMKYLKESVDSCLSQSFEDLELIVVLDGSTDDSQNILKEYSDPRLRIEQIANRGQAEATNYGFTLARGKLWTWTSDDNVFETEALAHMVNALSAHPECGMVKAVYTVIDESGKPMHDSSFACACFLYRADDARRIGGYRSQFRWVEDVDFFIRLQHSAGPIHFIDKPLYRYRVHSSSMTNRNASKRQHSSLSMYHDLITRGIYRQDLKEVYRDRLIRALVLGDFETADQIFAHARSASLPFISELEKLRSRLGFSPFRWFMHKRIGLMGWMANLYRKFIMEHNDPRIVRGNSTAFSPSQPGS